MQVITNRTGGDIAVEVLMVRQGGVGPIMVVEGPTDEQFFSSRVQPQSYIAIGSGRNSVETALTLLDSQPLSGILGVIDEDYDWLIQYKPSSQNVIKCDPRDLETLLFRITRGDCLLAEFATRDAINRFVVSEGCSFLDAALRRAEPFGRIRMVNSSGPQVCLKQLKPLRFFRNDWSYNVDDAFNVAVQLGVAPSVEELRRRVTEVNFPDIWHCVRGHDLVDIFVGGIISVFGGGGINNVSAERILRQAVPTPELKKTLLGQRIGAWEQKYGPILRE